MSDEASLTDKNQAIRNAVTLEDRLRAILDYYSPRVTEGWWPFDQDHPEFKRGAIFEDNFWRSQIEAALTLHAEESYSSEQEPSA